MFKFVLFFLLFFLNVQIASSQYLMPEFTVSIAKMKQGLPLREKFNYDCVSQRMVFLDQDEIMALSNVEMLDTLFLGQHKMIPYLSRFLDVVYSGLSFSLLVDYKYKKVNEGKIIQGWGLKTQGTIHSIDMRSIGQNPDAEHLRNIEAWKYMSMNSYFLSFQSKKKRFSDLKSLIKVLPEKKEKIDAFVSKHKVDFENVTDVIELVKSLD